MVEFVREFFLLALLVLASIPSAYAQCTENWFCGEWGFCRDGFQNRSCRELNGCSNPVSKPQERRGCDIGLSLVIMPVTAHGGQCITTALDVKNPGRSQIGRIVVRDLVSDCCMIRSLENLTFLGPGQEGRIPLEVCIKQDAEADEYEDLLTVTASSGTAMLKVEVAVAQTYQEALLARLAGLESDLESLDRKALGPFHSQLFDTVKTDFEGIKFLIENRLFDQAEFRLKEAGDKIQILRDFEPPLIISNLLWIVPIPVVVLFLFVLRYLRRPRLPKAEKPREEIKLEKPPVVTYFQNETRENMIPRDNIIASIQEFEKRLSSIRKRNMGKTELFYYNKIRKGLDSIRESIIKGDFRSAAMAIGEVESNFKILEYRLLSYKLIEKRDLRENR